MDGKGRERLGGGHRAGGSALELVTSKLRRPSVRPGTVTRPALIERLEQEDSRRIVSVVAPAGYGKTTLLAQWAERHDQAFAWVSVDEKDNDPKVLLTYVAEALNAVYPVRQPVFDALASPASSVLGSVVPRLGAAFASIASPVVLVLDDVHLLHDLECQAALSMLADHVPAGSRFVLAGRSDPPVRLARLRAEGKLLEIGPGDLALTREEAASLLRAAGTVLAASEVADLHSRTEGWPVGLYLAALCLREGGSLPAAAAVFDGADRFVSGYLESELLARISLRHRAFLTQTAVLERMCGPLCEAVLELPGSAATLAELARSNLLLVPLDRHGVWYRYHHLFRDMLQAELHNQEPGLAPVLQHRAANWCLQNDLPEAALEYFMAAGNVDEAAQLVETLWDPAYRQGQITTRQRWIDWLDDRAVIDKHPMLAVWASYFAGETGRPREAERWADVVDRWQYGDPARPADPIIEGWAATLRAALGRGGVEQMRADADEAARQFAAQNNLAPLNVPFLQGLARVYCGDLAAGGGFLEQVIGMADAESPDGVAWPLCIRSLLAMTRNEWTLAEADASRARSALRGTSREDSYATPLVCAVQARVAVHRGDIAAARQELVSAQRLRHLLTYAFPYMAVQARIELARVHLAVADLEGARTLMREIDEILRQRPGLGTLVGQAKTLRDQLSSQGDSGAQGPSALTAAELRLLPYLQTHLTYAEIGQHLYVSTNTVKTQIKTVYRKLDVSTRHEAIERARQAGLLDR
jgi:LuxR family maltose regulon positive regulatory protein